MIEWLATNSLLAVFLICFGILAYAAGDYIYSVRRHNKDDK